jgi:acyl carrier protein
VTDDEVRAGLTDIWTGMLGTEPRDDDDFFGSGGSSMELVMLMVAIQDRFGISLSIDELFTDSFTFGTGVNSIVRATRA